MAWIKKFVWLISLITVACSPAAPVETIQADRITQQSIPVTSAPQDTATVRNTHTAIVTETTEYTLQANATEKVYLPTVTSTARSTPRPSVGMIADHTVIDDFENIPVSALQAAAAVKAVFFHQSTGGYITFLGLDCLAGKKNDPNTYPECVKYETANNPYQWNNWDWRKDWEIADAEAKATEFKSLVPRVQSGADVIGMKFCYVDGWNQDFTYYREAMEQLESQYPDKVFIWSTSALWAEPEAACAADNPFNSCKAIAQFNEDVRAYVVANNKPFYDIAAIESDDGRCNVAGYEGLCPEYYSDGGGHPNLTGSIRLAKGFWWLMARISGWSG